MRRSERKTSNSWAQIMKGEPLVEVRYPEVKVGDLVKMICHDRFTPGSDIGIVVKVVDCGRWADDVVVLSGDGDFVEWEQDELKVIQ